MTDTKLTDERVRELIDRWGKRNVRHAAFAHTASALRELLALRELNKELVAALEAAAVEMSLARCGVRPSMVAIDAANAALAKAKEIG